jgi:hypothetical protein
VAKSEGLVVAPQDMTGFAHKAWSDDTQLWVQGRNVGDFVELEIIVPHWRPPGTQRLTLYATKSWDYGIVKFTVNGKAAGPEGGKAVDLFSGQHGKAVATGAIELGEFSPDKDGVLILRAEVVGGNPKAEGTKAFFGLDCVVAEGAKP